MVPGESGGVYFIRFAVCAYNSESRHIKFAYEKICECLTNLNAKN